MPTRDLICGSAWCRRLAATGRVYCGRCQERRDKYRAQVARAHETGETVERPPMVTPRGVRAIQPQQETT